MRLFCALCQKMIRSSSAIYDHISSITHAPCSHKRLKGTIYYALRRIHFYSQNGDILLPDSYCSSAAVTQKRFYLGGISKNTFHLKVRQPNYRVAHQSVCLSYIPQGFTVANDSWACTQYILRQDRHCVSLSHLTLAILVLTIWDMKKGSLPSLRGTLRRFPKSDI